MREIIVTINSKQAIMITTFNKSSQNHLGRAECIKPITYQLAYLLWHKSDVFRFSQLPPPQKKNREKNIFRANIV